MLTVEPKPRLKPWHIGSNGFEFRYVKPLKMLSDEKVYWLKCLTICKLIVTALIEFRVDYIIK